MSHLSICIAGVAVSASVKTTYHNWQMRLSCCYSSRIMSIVLSRTLLILFTLIYRKLESLPFTLCLFSSIILSCLFYTTSREQTKHNSQMWVWVWV